MTDDTTATVEVVSPFIRIGDCIINTDAIRNCKIEPKRFELYYTDGTRETFTGDDAEVMAAFFADFATPVEPPPPPVVLTIADEPEAETEPAPAAEPATEATEETPERTKRKRSN